MHPDSQHDQSGLAQRLPIIERCDVLAELDTLLSEARASGRMLGIVVLDVCQIDEINNQFGYAIGDALMRAVTELAAATKRPTDMIFRISTHELLLVLPDLKSDGLPILASQRIQKNCTQRFQIDEQTIKPTLKMGISIFPNDAKKADELVRCADAALLQSRRLNQAIVSYGESRIGFETAIIETRFDLESAIDNGELFCDFQPKIHLAEGRLIGAESLARWRTGDGTMISPARFIPVAESNGLITPLTFRCLNESLRECSELQQTCDGFTVAVNVSTRVLREPDLLNIVNEALEIWQLPHERLILEITESALMDDIEESIALLKGFRDLGIGVSIDDFGTGHSSLAYLRRLPATELKIDRSFVQTVNSDKNTCQLVKAIIDLAASFGLKTVAEGIEDEGTLDLLRDMRCTMAQGFHLARPMPPHELPAWLADSPWRAPATLARTGTA